MNLKRIPLDNSCPTSRYIGTQFSSNSTFVNASDAAVKQNLDLARLVDLPNTLDGLNCADAVEFDRIANTIGTVVEALEPYNTDDEGFRILCEAAQLQWLRFDYVRDDLAQPDRGPCPRKQDVPEDRRVIGRPEAGPTLRSSNTASPLLSDFPFH